MCGIVGFISNTRLGASKRNIETLRDLVTANTVRGFDGTGMFGLTGDAKGKVFSIKDSVQGGALLDTKLEWSNLCEDSRFVVAHNRAATIGHVSKETTHPFAFDNVIGVHNGTVMGWETLFNVPKGSKIQVDSEALFYELDKLEPDTAAVTEFLASLSHEAYALAWYDSRSNSLNFARNSQRPLNFAYAGTDVYFASELMMLTWILARRKIKVQATASLETHTLVRIPMHEKASPEVVKYEPVNTSSSYGWSDNYTTPWGWGDGTGNAHTWTAPKTASAEKPAHESNNIGAFTPEPADPTHPMYIDVTEFGTLPQTSAIDGVRPEMYQASKELFGVDILNRSKMSYDIRDALANELEGETSVEIDAMYGGVYCTMVVCSMSPIRGDLSKTTQSHNLYGYLARDNGERVFVSVRATSQALIESINDIFEEGCVCIIDRVSIIGLRFYAYGHLGLIGMPIHTTYGMLITPGPAYKENEEVLEEYGEYHPGNTDLTKPAGKNLWRAGWKEVA